MPSSQHISRRTFARGAAAAGVVAAAGGGTIAWVVAGDGGRAAAFAVDHGPDVYVWMGQGEQFTVRVHSRDGAVLERFESQTAATLADLESAHVSFRKIAAPAAA